MQMTALNSEYCIGYTLVAMPSGQMYCNADIATIISLYVRDNDLDATFAEW